MKRRSGVFISLTAFAFALTACGGGGGGGGTLPSGTGSATPTPTPTSTPVQTQGLACPTTGAVPAAVAQAAATQTTSLQVAKRGVSVPWRSQRYVENQIAVTYSGDIAEQYVGERAHQFQAVRVRDLDYGSSTTRTRILAVSSSEVDKAMAQLSALPGVQHVGRVSYRQLMTANDPYYVPRAGTTAPYYQNATNNGQWDMHVMNLDGAWAQFPSTPVVGAAIAVVDTGADLTHPDLQGGKVIHTVCFVTYPSTSPQTTGRYITDTDGHGTNVAGIAGASTNNGFGFVGAGYGAPLLLYRIFPTDPSGGCEGSSSAQCSASSLDEASAIRDAVANHAKVINLSLGGPPPCSQSDPEYQAVEYAISQGVVMVAAAGNSSAGSLDCPAADPGVIAVGASALNDVNPLAIKEYVAAYSNWSSVGGQGGGGAYLVAPGSDPSGGNDSDNLHWIQNIYSSTAYNAARYPSCSGSFDNFGEARNCNTEIAGTSQATPHVAGVVSLMLAKNPLLSPAQIATGLCESADNINDAKQGCGRVNASAAVSWAATH